MNQIHSQKFYKNFWPYGAYVLCGLIALYGMFCHFAFIQNVAAHPTLNILLPKSDAFTYDLTAKNLCMGKPLSLKMPVYPLFTYYLAFIYSLLGTDQLTLYCVQGLLSLASALLLALIGKTVFDRWTGILAGLFYLFYKMTFLYDVLATDTNFSQFMIILTLFFYVRNRYHPSLWNFIGFALTGVALSILRVFAWFLVIPGIFYFILNGRQWEKKEYILSHFIIIILSIFLFFQFHTAENYSHKFGVHFYIGNSAESEGVLTKQKGIYPNAEGFAKDSILVAYKETGTTKNLNWFWIKETWKSHQGNLGSLFSVWWKKIKYLTNSYEPHNVASVYYYESKTNFSQLPHLNYGILFSLAVIGILFMIKDKKGMLLLLPFAFLFFMIFLIFISSRYRMPLIPFVCLFASFGLFQFIRSLQQKDLRTCLLFLLLFLTALLWTFQPIQIFNRNKDIQFWEMIEKKQVDYQKNKKVALHRLENWEELSDTERILLTIQFAKLDMYHQFFSLYHEVIYSPLNSEMFTISLISQKALVYEQIFNFKKAIDTWYELWEFKRIRPKAIKKIRELEIIGPLLDDEFKN